MKIYRGDIGIDMSLDSFLQVLENDFAEDIFATLLGLDSIASGEFDDIESYGFYGAEGQYDQEDFEEYLEDLRDERYNVEVMSMDADEFKQSFGIDIEDVIGASKANGENVLDMNKSQEDMHVERIARKYAHIDNPSY